MTHCNSASVLIVDDFPSWRARVREILATYPEWKLISEAPMGREAVQEAEELQPDIVVLDIALPCLNRIETAKMILAEISQVEDSLSDAGPRLRH